MGAITIPVDPTAMSLTIHGSSLILSTADETRLGEVSDGYHTFNELYEHKYVLFLALCRALGMGWKSKFHSDGSMFAEYFVCGVTLPGAGDITYHLPMYEWENASFLRVLERAPSWDGHTPVQVSERLRKYASRPKKARK